MGLISLVQPRGATFCRGGREGGREGGERSEGGKFHDRTNDTT